MLKTIMVSAAAFVLCIGAASAGDFPPDARGDLNCAVVGLELSAAPTANTQVQQAGLMIAVYYLGRLHGRLPGIDLESPITDAANALTPERFDTERLRCAAEIQGVGQDLQAMGARIQAREDQRNP